MTASEKSPFSSSSFFRLKRRWKKIKFENGREKEKESGARKWENARERRDTVWRHMVYFWKGIGVRKTRLDCWDGEKEWKNEKISRRARHREESERDVKRRKKSFVHKIEREREREGRKERVRMKMNRLDRKKSEDKGVRWSREWVSRNREREKRVSRNREREKRERDEWESLRGRSVFIMRRNIWRCELHKITINFLDLWALHVQEELIQIHFSPRKSTWDRFNKICSLMFCLLKDWRLSKLVPSV